MWVVILVSVDVWFVRSFLRGIGIGRSFSLSDYRIEIKKNIWFG